MLKLPGRLCAETFLEHYWQKEPLFMQQALEQVRPSITRNEIGWLATLEDVESRLILTEHESGRSRYRAETGPFNPDYLASLPKRNWTLLVHDVEKHLPVMRKLFGHVPFIPDWRIDDLMVSFAAPGGGVGPHRDNYDVFLCQGIGTREWHVTTEDIAADPGASDDLALTRPFAGQIHSVRQGDVLYLPPGAAHWGTATRACITYSIGMRAPQLSDLLTQLPDAGQLNPFYRDPDLGVIESVPGLISEESVGRALQLAGAPQQERDRIAAALGRYVTQTKEWLTPDVASPDEARSIVASLTRGARLVVHGMARIAWDLRNIYVNGACLARPGADSAWLESLCANREMVVPSTMRPASSKCLIWMLEKGLFELPEKL
jgi:50S ribosomal protein L16 3-hydroxylase